MMKKGLARESLVVIIIIVIFLIFIALRFRDILGVLE